MRLKKIFLALAVISLTICVLMVGIKYKEHEEYTRRSEKALNSLSFSLNIEPSWEKVRYEIYCNILANGKTLDEIQNDLSNLTPINMFVDDKENLYYTVYFTDPYVRLDNVGLAFDSDYRLVDKFRRVGVGDVGPITCP
jgi:hypothetical protein